MEKGDFLHLLSSTKVETFLKWLIKEGLLIHYHILDPLYWSIVDIIDSILTEDRNIQLMMLAPMMKNDLYTLLRHDVDRTVDLFQRYSYPNVGKQQRVAFIDELKEVLEQRRSLLPDFNFQIMKSLLYLATRLESLSYLEDEKPNVLIDRFSNFYIHPYASSRIHGTSSISKRRLKRGSPNRHFMTVSECYRITGS